MAQASKQARFFQIVAISCFLAFGGLGAKCDGMENEDDVTLATTACSTGKANISIHDGFVQNHCGCVESTNQVSTTLTCTVPVGTTIFVHFLAARLPHQLVAVGSPAIPTGMIYNPSQGATTPTFGFKLDGTAGDVFEFRDQYDPNISGQFILN